MVLPRLRSRRPPRFCDWPNCGGGGDGTDAFTMDSGELVASDVLDNDDDDVDDDSDGLTNDKSLKSVRFIVVLGT